MFLIDGSASVERYGIGNFRRLIDFVRDVVIGFRVSRGNTRVGAIVFGTKPYVLFGFNKYTNNGALFNKLNQGVQYPKSGSRIGRALLMAQNRLFRKNSRRSRTTKVVVIITDGSSMDDVAGPSNALKALGVRIYCVGVGRYINGRQLDIMASPPRKNHIFTADWNHLNVIVNDLRNAVCLGEFYCISSFVHCKLSQVKGSEIHACAVLLASLVLRSSNTGLSCNNIMFIYILLFFFYFYFFFNQQG